MIERLLFLHCGLEPRLLRFETLEPTDAEAKQGIKCVEVYERLCDECRRSLIYKQERGLKDGLLVRVKDKNELKALRARMMRVCVSYWVWGYHPETFQKVKKWVS